jgi:hypothetical protein
MQGGGAKAADILTEPEEPFINESEIKGLTPGAVSSASEAIGRARLSTGPPLSEYQRSLTDASNEIISFKHAWGAKIADKLPEPEEPIINEANIKGLIPDVVSSASNTIGRETGYQLGRPYQH